MAATAVAADPANVGTGKTSPITKVAARRFKLAYYDDYYDMTVYALRIGGGASPVPVFDLPAGAVVGSLGDAPSTVQLSASPGNTFGASGPVSWTIGAATPALAGLSITPGGLLSLPAKTAATGPWTFTATVTNAAGFKATRNFVVNKL